ncbi:XRCC4-like factor-domain-containing protein [Podospora aff. communis PSN243]|uniref:Non-homologous end-joining factor 1 n=1 Tax=Podospora aff. communis PSN243 TaxID=3040156 RepID=A0AAV9GFG9_9PEZI|nr:XRCC4-like factor-domain-containing protein [Podospora aff. communis PSN243]
MSAHPQWRLLPGTVPGIPTLLVSTSFTAESYKIQITDLANLWGESLDRKHIIKRGLVEDTSIDPTDGPDQLRKMTELIRAAFDPEDVENSNTSLSIGHDKDDVLLINVTCVLPKPLKPFKWPMQLSKYPHTSIATELVLPLIMAYETRARQINLLVTALREKDGVITRLVDKLEATGMGLEHVFSALSGKRKMDRAVAEKKVKGLAPFSEADFRREAGEPQVPAATTGISSILDEVFGGTGLSYIPDTELEASSTLGDWWTSLGKGKAVALAERPKESKTGTPLTTQTARGSSSGDEDEFQVQTTPPNLSSSRKRGGDTRSDVVDDDGTSDGEDDTMSSHKVSPTTRSHNVKSSGARVGALGVHRQPQPKPASSSPRMTPPRKLPASHGRATSTAGSETASDDDHGERPERSSSPRSPPKATQRRGGLGRIGGKSKDVVDPARPPSPTISNNADTPPKKHKLGVIGKKVDATPSPRASGSGEGPRGRSRSPSGNTNVEPPRETSQERADRKRAELQKDLQRKAAAGPAKKKRKF